MGVDNMPVENVSKVATGARAWSRTRRPGGAARRSPLRHAANAPDRAAQLAVAAAAARSDRDRDAAEAERGQRLERFSTPEPSRVPKPAGPSEPAVRTSA